MQDLIYTDVPKSFNVVAPSKNFWAWHKTKCGGDWSNVFKADQGKVLKMFDAGQELIPSQYLLRDSLLKMASCPQAHVMLRTSFGQSLAALSASQYVLGIGDRHLSNCMVDVITGELVGIDFGHAFDSATILLPVPELMPFRLSPQLVGVFHPYGIEGWFKLSMQHVLSALHEQQDPLRAALEVFVDEPLIDWVQAVEKKTKAKGPSPHMLSLSLSLSLSRLQTCSLSLSRARALARYAAAFSLQACSIRLVLTHAISFSLSIALRRRPPSLNAVLQANPGNLGLLPLLTGVRLTPTTTTTTTTTLSSVFRLWLAEEGAGLCGNTSRRGQDVRRK